MTSRLRMTWGMNGFKEMLHTTDGRKPTSFPTIDLCATGKNIRRLRIEAGLSVRELSQTLCLSDVQAVYRWERGVTLPSLDNLVLLSQIFCVPLESILAIIDIGHK